MDKFSVRTLWLINAGEGAEHREPSHTLVSGNVNWCDHYGKVMEVPQKKLKRELLYDSSFLFWMVLF